MSISMYDTRKMVAALEQMHSPHNWLRDTLFSDVEKHETTKVDIDVIKGSRRVATYVSPLKEGRVVNGAGYETNTYEAPYTKEKMRTTAQELMTRSPGENIYSPESRETRANKKLGKELKELNEGIDRLEELQCAEVIQTGKLTVFGEGIPKAIIDFNMEESHLPVLTGTARWSDLANATPLENLETWSNRVLQKSSIVPTMAIFGANAIKKFIKTTEVKETLNNRRINMGQINPTKLPQGVKYYGYLDEPGIDVYTYTDWYYDPISKKEKSFIDPDKIILTNPMARTTRHYGAIQDLDALTFVGSRFPKMWTTKDPSARWLSLQSAPLCAPHQIDAFLCAKVL